MIASDTAGSAAEFVARLTERARRLAQARSLTRTLESRRAPGRWRRADLLWPLFAEE